MLDQLLELLKQNPLLDTVYSGGIVAVLVKLPIPFNTYSLYPLFTVDEN